MYLYLPHPSLCGLHALRPGGQLNGRSAGHEGLRLQRSGLLRRLGIWGVGLGV